MAEPRHIRDEKERKPLVPAPTITGGGFGGGMRTGGGIPGPRLTPEAFGSENKLLVSDFPSSVTQPAGDFFRKGGAGHTPPGSSGNLPTKPGKGKALVAQIVKSAGGGADAIGDGDVFGTAPNANGPPVETNISNPLGGSANAIGSGDVFGFAPPESPGSPYHNAAGAAPLGQDAVISDMRAAGTPANEAGRQLTRGTGKAASNVGEFLQNLLTPVGQYAGGVIEEMGAGPSPVQAAEAAEADTNVVPRGASVVEQAQKLKFEEPRTATPKKTKAAQTKKAPATRSGGVQAPAGGDVEIIRGTQRSIWDSKTGNERVAGVQDRPTAELMQTMLTAVRNAPRGQEAAYASAIISAFTGGEGARQHGVPAAENIIVKLKDGTFVNQSSEDELPEGATVARRQGMGASLPHQFWTQKTPAQPGGLPGEVSMVGNRATGDAREIGGVPGGAGLSPDRRESAMRAFMQVAMEDAGNAKLLAEGRWDLLMPAFHEFLVTYGQ